MASSSSITAASEQGVGAWVGVPHGLFRFTGPSLVGERVFTTAVSMTNESFRDHLMAVFNTVQSIIKVDLTTISWLFLVKLGHKPSKTL